MDLYEEKNFDEWLHEDVKAELIKDLTGKWEHQTEKNCVFISALEKKNIELLRSVILTKVREIYRIRYPYKTNFFY